MVFDELNKVFERVIEYLLYAFVALFPFIIYQGFLYFGTTTRSINLVLFSGVLAVVFGFVLFKKETKLSVIKSPVTLFFGLFILILFVSSLWGVDFESSFWSRATRTTGLFYFIHLFFFYLLLAGFLAKNENRIDTLIRIFLISAGIFSIGSLLGNEGAQLIFSDKAWAGFTFGNSTFAAMYLYVAFILSIYYVFSRPITLKNFGKIFLPIIFLINPYIINFEFWSGKINIFKTPFGVIGSAQTTSFVILFSIIGLLFAWLIMKLKSRVRQNYILGGAFVLVLFSLAFFAISLLTTDGFFEKLYLRQASPARPIVWNLSLKAISERPYLGWGVDNFGYAFEKYYDNRLLEAKNGGEAWFDRAHNVFVDQLVETGYFGLAFYLVLYLSVLGCLFYVFARTSNPKHRLLAICLLTYFIGHLIELQTAFDTTISYFPFIVLLALATVIFYQTIKTEHATNGCFSLPFTARGVIGGILVLGFGYFFFAGTLPIINSQIANSNIRTVGSSEKRFSFYETLFNTPIDEVTFLWRSSYDLQRGISVSPNLIENTTKRQGFAKEFDLIVAEYEKYVQNKEMSYRAKIQLAETYIYQRLFGVDNLDKAHQVLTGAIKLIPNTPQAYWLESVAYLYQMNFNKAKESANFAYNLNPNILESQRLIEYINRSIKTFPEIDLYSFVQL